MNYYFTLEQQAAGLTVEDGMDIIFHHALNRSDFVAEFSGIDLTQTRQLSYEPARSILHIIEADWSLTVLESASDDPRMNYIESNLAAMKTWFETKKAEEDAAFAAGGEVGSPA